jgi:hypothetical protein
MELNLGNLDDRAQRFGAPFGRRQLEVGVLLVDDLAQEIGGELGAFEQPDRIVDVVREELGAIALLVAVVRFDRPLEPGPEHRVDREIGIRVRRDRADLDPGRLLVA